MKNFLNFRLQISLCKRTISHSFYSSILWFAFGRNNLIPNYVKHSVLINFFLRNCFTIESGTYLGESTKKFQKYSSKVFSIEPEKKLYSFAKKRLKRFKKITIINGSSEDALQSIIDLLPKGSCINFWLDGHYSEGYTFKGKTDSPIQHELQKIAENLNKFKKIRIAIDDFKDFGMINKSGYLSRGDLVKWADTNGFFWNVEMGIFLLSKDNV